MTVRSRLNRAQSGFTIVEVMVAALVILTALGVVVTTAVKIRGLSTTGETKGVATTIAQQELDRLRSLGWEQLQMNGTPTASGTTVHPERDPLSSTYLSGTSYRPSATAQLQPLVIGAAPASGETDLRSVDYNPTHWVSGRVEGDLYRFVTAGDDSNCTSCPSTDDYRRLTVAVTVTKPVGAIANPIIVSTEFANPTDSQTSTVTTGGAPPAPKSGLTFYPYDTQAIYTTRQDQTADHNRRDTQVKPDLMGEDPPPDPNSDPNNPTQVLPTWNYTKDTSTTPTCLLADGVTVDQCGASIKKSGPVTPSCSGGGSDKEHEWVSNPLTADVKLVGNGTFDMFTRTMGTSALPGRVCVTVYDVPGTLKADGSINGTQTVIGSMIVPGPGCGGNIPCYPNEMNPWPTDWYELQFNFRFLPTATTYYTVTAGRRIGIYVTAADHLASNSATNSTDLAFMYDHPDYPSSFGLETQQ